MSDADIEKAVKEAAEYEAQDKKRKEGIDARNEADSMVFQVENTLKEVGDKLDPSEKANVEADLAALKAVVDATANMEISDSQLDELKAGKEKLMNSAQNLFAKMYEQSQGGAAGAGPDMNYGNAGADQGGSDDDVVDADYREV